MRGLVVVLLAGLAALAGCGGGSSPASPAAAASSPSTTATSAAPAPLCTSTGTTAVTTTTFASGLSSPWGMALLPDGRVLVTQKAGSFVMISADGTRRTTLAFSGGARPDIRNGGQGGLLDVALDPDFATSPWVYFAYQEPGDAGFSGTAVGRAQLSADTLTNFQRLYQQVPKRAWDGVHFGARLAFRADKSLLVSLGDRGQDDPASPGLNNAQSLATTLGKIVRIQRDGTVPADNPFTGTAGARPEIWSLGHRNPQGLVVSPIDGTVWSTEHGPQGGDELNRVAAGNNHGWPLRSYGCPYGATVGTACQVNGGQHAPLNGLSFVEPTVYWGPTSTAPSNLIQHDGRGVPAWRGQFFIGALAGQRLWRVALNTDGSYASCEAMLSGLNQRIRDVRQAADGAVWILTDEGQIHRMTR